VKDMRKNKTNRILILAIIILLAVLVYHLKPKEKANGTICGVVTDNATGRPVWGATVKAVDEEGHTSKKREETTNKEGSFEIELAEGTYTLKFESAQYQPFESEEPFYVKEGKKTEINKTFSLEPLKVPTDSPTPSVTDTPKPTDRQPSSPTPKPITPHHAITLSEINTEALEEMDKNTEEYIYQRTQKDKNVKINSVRHVGNVFMAKKENWINKGNEKEINNKLYNLFEVDMTYTENVNGEVYQGRFTSIYYRRYKNIWVESNGNCSVDISNSAEPANYTETIYNSDGSDSLSKEILGKKTIKDVKDFLYGIKNNKEYYNIEYEGE